MNRVFLIVLFTSSSALSEEVRIKNNDLAAEFVVKAHGVAFKSLRDIKTDTEFLSGEGHFFRIDFEADDGKAHALYNFDKWSSVRHKALSAYRHSFKFVKSTGIQVECEILLDGETLATTLTVLVQPDFVKVGQIHFPHVQLRPIGNAPSQNFLHFPLGSGMVLENPWKQDLYIRSLPYPSGMTTYQMTGLYNKSTGLYVATHDPVAHMKKINVSTPKPGRTLLFDFSWIPPAGHKRLRLTGQQIFRVVRGDWFDAAMVYRQWVAKQAPWWPSNQSQKLLADIAFWIQDTCVPGSDCINSIIAFRKELKLPIGFHWYVWHQIPFDRYYPHFFPAKPGFTEDIIKLRASGIRVMPYINAHVWDRDLPDFPDSCALSTQKGELLFFDKTRLARMCPTQSYWRKTINNVVSRLVYSNNVDGVYMDQMSAVPPYECFNKTHGHPLGGGNWWMSLGNVPWLSQLRSQLPKGVFLTSEWNAEPFVADLDAFLVNHFEMNNQQPIFAAIYGDRILRFGRFHDGGPDNIKAFRMKLGQSLVYGDQLGWLRIKHLEHHELRRMAIEFARARYRFMQYFSYGEMLRPPLIVGFNPPVTADWFYYWQPRVISLPSILSGAWRLPNGSSLAIFVNVDDNPHTFRTALPLTSIGDVWMGGYKQQSNLTGAQMNAKDWTMEPGQILFFVSGSERRVHRR